MVSRKFLAIGLIVGLLIGLPACFFLLNELADEPKKNGSPTPTVSPNSNASPDVIESPSPTQSYSPNQKIACTAVESFATSNMHYGRSPVIAYYYPEEGYVPMPQSADLSLDVKNNNTLPLYDVAVEVTYETSDGSWNTAKSTIAFLDSKATKRISITLSKPELITKGLTRMTPSGFIANGTLGYVLSIEDLKIAAYGFPSPR